MGLQLQHNALTLPLAFLMHLGRTPLTQIFKRPE